MKRNAPPQIAVDPGFGIPGLTFGIPGGGGGGGGIKGQCAIGFCESGNCATCQEGLECVNPTPGAMCAGACFGVCREIIYDCVNCADLGWGGLHPGGDTPDLVCSESDGEALGGECLDSVNFDEVTTFFF